MRQALRLLGVLSLDVVAGANAWAILWARVLGTPIDWRNHVALSLVVWLVYALDHLLDARSIPHQASSRRHAYYQRHRSNIWLVWWLLMGIATPFCLFLLPFETILIGFAVGTLVVIHFIIHVLLRPQGNLILQKELGTAMAFTLGVLLGPLSLVEGLRFPLGAQLLLAQCFLLALTNLVLFSLFDQESDTTDQQSSMVRLVGAKRARLLLVLFSLTFLVAFAGQLVLAESLFDWVVQALVFLIFAGHALLLIFYPYFAERERYRVVADWLFSLPFFVLLF